MSIYLFRHGVTKGNAERRYISSTDESLLEEERLRLAALFRERIAQDPDLAKCRRIVISPMKRCRETAEILIEELEAAAGLGERTGAASHEAAATESAAHEVEATESASHEAEATESAAPETAIEINVIPALRECDFGSFEYRNYEDLKDEPAYQRFLDTMGESGFPGGEDRRTFSARCAEAFEKAVREWREPLIFVVHGGTIMAVMEAFAEPRKDYYDWQVRPGEGFKTEPAFTGSGIVLRPVSSGM